jgi:phage/plasmid-like protein (TIGR03299 family)
MVDYKKMAEHHDLGWDVEKVRLFTEDQRETEFFAVRREDNKHVFTTVKDGYVPFQNSDLFQLADAIANESNLPVHKAGHIADGGKVFIQLNAGSINGIGQNNDTINNFVTCINSHDGSSAVRWGYSNITISCENTFYAVRSKLKSSSRHTDKMHQRIKEGIEHIRLVREAQERYNDKMYALSEVPVDDKDINLFLQRIVGFDINKPEDELRDKLHGRAVNRAMDIKKSVMHELSYKGNNLWALFNGVTHYTSHSYGREGTRLESKMLGQAAILDERALTIASEMLN